MHAALIVLMSISAGVELDAAKKAYVDVDYARCREKAQAALTQPGQRDDRVQTYRLLGLCSAAHGDVDDAREAFRLMLVIDRDAKLPDGLSPRFTSSFREAKGSLVGQAPLTLSLVKEGVKGATRTVRVKLDDESGVVATITAKAKDGASVPPAKKAAEVELEVPAAVGVDVIGLDAFGGEVVQLSLPAVARSTKVDERPVAEAPEEASIMPVVVVGAVIGGVLVVGGAAGLVAALLAPPSAVTLRTDIGFAE